MLRSSKDRSGCLSTYPAHRKIIPGHFWSLLTLLPSLVWGFFGREVLSNLLGSLWRGCSAPGAHTSLCIQDSVVFHVLLLENKQFQELQESQPAFLQPRDLYWSLWCLVKFCSSEALAMVGEFLKILFPLGAL